MSTGSRKGIGDPDFASQTRDPGTETDENIGHFKDENRYPMIPQFCQPEFLENAFACRMEKPPVGRMSTSADLMTNVPRQISCLYTEAIPLL